MTISAVFLALAFRGLQLEQFWGSLADVSLPWLLAGMAVYGAAVVVIALRWQFLLRALKFVPLAALTQLVLIGYMGNNVYPLRAGEALRILLLRRNHGLPILRSTTIVAIERLFDGCVMLSFVLFSLLLIDIEAEELKTIVSVSAPLFALALLIALSLATRPNLLRRVVSLALDLLPRRIGEIVASSSEELLAGFEGLRRPSHLLGAVICSYVTWGIEAGAYYVVMRAFDLGLSYTVALLLVGAVNLAGLIPASPGQIGVYEFVVINILAALGIAIPLATACAVVAHITIWLPTTVTGFFLLLKQGLGWADVSRANTLKSVESAQSEATLDIDRRVKVSQQRIQFVPKFVWYCHLGRTHA